MAPNVLSLATAALALASAAQAQYGSGFPHATVTGSGNSYTASVGSNQVYSGSDYREAIQKALDSISSGQRVAVLASGSIGASTITITSGKTFEGCGTIDVGNRSGRGAIESTDASDVKIPYLSMTGNPYFGLRFSGMRGLSRTPHQWNTPSMEHAPRLHRFFNPTTSIYHNLPNFSSNHFKLRCGRKIPQYPLFNS
ncbi:uncharacterized protein P884DRAFT_125618 [Thermothelomyces heterothallicus CBS 202.75]|uniref:uncharacterized protein n=1 Tax=Thermothelomyces heterothallicus CBS 202.75 TaxID=1149848 RepID=UPI0037444491